MTNKGTPELHSSRDMLICSYKEVTLLMFGFKLQINLVLKILLQHYCWAWVFTNACAVCVTSSLSSCSSHLWSSSICCCCIISCSSINRHCWPTHCCMSTSLSYTHIRYTYTNMQQKTSRAEQTCTQTQTHEEKRVHRRDVETNKTRTPDWWEAELRWWTLKIKDVNGMTNHNTQYDLHVSQLTCVCMYVCVKWVSYLHHRAPQCHVLSVRKVLCMHMCVDMVARVCVCVVCVQHSSLWGVQSAGYRGESVGTWIPCHLTPKRGQRHDHNGETALNRSIQVFYN